MDLLEDEDDHEDNEVGTIFSEERRFIRSDVFEFPPPPSYVQSKKIDSDDSIFGEDSEHVDSEHVTSPDGGKNHNLGGKNLTPDLTRTNSITFNIKKGNIKRSQMQLKVTKTIKVAFLIVLHLNKSIPLQSPAETSPPHRLTQIHLECVPRHLFRYLK